MNELSEKELYCVAKVMQSVIFTPNHSMFYGCNYCKHLKECMPNKHPHKDMIFDRVRLKLQNITAVDLSLFESKDKFNDHSQYKGAVHKRKKVKQVNKKHEKQCPTCNRINSEVANFCTECGQKLEESCNCWIKKEPNNCGYDKCPDYKLYKDRQIHIKKTNSVKKRIRKLTEKLLDAEFELSEKETEFIKKHLDFLLHVSTVTLIVSIIALIVVIFRLIYLL